MNEGLVVVVQCYSGDVGMVEHQLPYYLHHEAPMLLLSPEDAPACVEHPKIKCVPLGGTGWAGRTACNRFHAHCRRMLEEPGDWFIVFEPDSICLSPALPDYLYERTDTLWCMAWTTPGQPDYNTPPPWFAHRDAWEKVVETMDEHIEDWLTQSEAMVGWGHGTGELIAQAVTAGDIPADAYKNYGYDYNEHTPSKMFEGAERGAEFYTGFKRPETFDNLVLTYKASQE